MRNVQNEQLCTDYCPPARQLGERRLLGAILMRAALDLATPEIETHYDDARGWVLEGSTEPFGFGWVCAGVGLEMTSTRRQLLYGDVGLIHQRSGYPATSGG